MKVKKLFFLVLLFLWSGQIAMSQQPYAPCWHPLNLKGWNPSMDPDFQFNKATIKLQPRFQNINLNANPYQHYEGQLCAMITMNDACSTTPSQDAFNFIGCNPTFWQYIDILVWWGGSASEGIIVPPSAPAIDVAHMNGVKILGTIFFPPSAYGGTGEWIDQMLTMENGEYIYAKKLYEIAVAYGFDGWMINEETYHGGNPGWSGFIKEFEDCKKADGNDHMIIGWYDNSMNVSSRQGLLQNGIYYMQEYASSKHINENLQRWLGFGWDEEDFVQRNYMGCQQDIASDEFSKIFSKNKHNASVFIFKPEETTWKKFVGNLIGKPSASGETAYSAMKSSFKAESTYWVQNANPSSTDGWNAQVCALSTAMSERSVIQSTPFITSFSAGLGKHRFVNGEKRNTQDWYHRGMQDILPTWRWWTEAGCNLSFDYNWDDAYNNGTSIGVEGSLTANRDNLIRLFKTNMIIKSGDKVQLVYKTSVSGSIEVKLGTSNNTSDLETFKLNTVKTENGWTIGEADLSSISGKTVCVIALNFKSTSTTPSYTASLGQLGIFNKSYTPSALPVTNLKTESKLTTEGGDLRITWDVQESTDVHHYNIYMTQGNERKLIGQTRNGGFYIPEFKRTSTNETSVKIEVVTVSNDYKEGIPSVLEVKYPSREQITVKCYASQTLVKTGTNVTITAEADNSPTSYTWAIPQNATLVSGQGTSKAVFSFSQEGLYDISVTVANEVASVTYSQSNMIEVNNDKSLELVSVDKSIYSCSKWNEGDNEAPEYLLDGKYSSDDVTMHEKWCASGNREYTVIIDLEQIYNIYRTRIMDCQVAESGDNFNNYRIYISKDAQDWKPVIEKTEQRSVKIKDDYIAPTEGRYVKLNIYDKSPFTIRVWEFEIYGTELGEHSIQQQEDLVIGLSAEQENKLTFDWGGEADDDYAFTVESFNENLLTTEIGKIDLQAKTVSYKMKTGTEQGVAKVAVHFRKGEYTRSTIFNVNVTDLENINRAAGKIATILKAGTGYDEDDGMTQYPSIKKHIEYLTDENDETFAMTSYDEVDTELEFDLEAIYGINKVEIVLKNISGVTAVPKNLKFYAADDETKEYREFISKSCNVGTNTYEISRQNMRFVKLVLPATDELMGYAVCEVRIFGKEVADKYMPLELSGYNIDIIAESTPIQSSSVAMSTQTNNLPSFVWVSRSILPEYGLPESGKITSQSGVRYQLAPYNGANAVKSVGKENAILSLNKGVKAKKIHILVTAGPGDSPYSTTKAAYARVRYTDGTTADHNNGSFFWMRRFNNLNESDQQVTANPIAIKGIKGYNWNSEALFDSECCLAEISINTNPEKEIASVELQGYQNDEWGYILAATAEEVSWIVGIEKSTADNSEIKIYPNPVRKGNSLTVETTDAKTIRLMTLQGVTISNQNINTPITTIQTDNLTTGTYLLIISGKDYTKTMKIIVK